jgi:hypothetical protein
MISSCGFCKRPVLLHVLYVMIRVFVTNFCASAGKIPCMRTVFWEDHQLKMIDQRILPGRFEILSFQGHASVARAIKEMVVRGAPAIGATAAFGLALAGF